MSLFSKATCLSAAAILTASLGLAPAAAAGQPPAQPADAEATGSQDADTRTGTHIIVYGAIKDPASEDVVAAPEDPSVPELPVVYEEEAEAPKLSAPAAAEPPASPARR